MYEQYTVRIGEYLVCNNRQGVFGWNTKGPFGFFTKKGAEKLLSELKKEFPKQKMKVVKC